MTNKLRHASGPILPFQTVTSIHSTNIRSSFSVQFFVHFKGQSITDTGNSYEALLLLMAGGRVQLFPCLTACLIDYIFNNLN